jgi:hypothetical protein
MFEGLKKYIAAENPVLWLFNEKELDGCSSTRTSGWALRAT